MTMSNFLRFWPLVSGMKILAASLLMTGLFFSVEASAMGELVGPSEIERFEELRSVRNVTCSEWAWKVKIEGLEGIEPSATIAKERSGKGPRTTGYVFNDKKTRVLALFEADTSNLTAVDARVTAVAPHDYPFLAMPGALALAPYKVFEPNACQAQGAGCAYNLRIVADPEHKDFFPTVGTFFETESGNLFIAAGNCRKGIHGNLKEELATWRQDLHRLQREATCKFRSPNSRASEWIGNWLNAGVAYLVDKGAAKTDLVSALKWFEVANRHIDHLSPDTRVVAADTIGAAREIATERMTTEQIAEAERLALAWTPEPVQCEREGGTKKDKPTRQK